MSQVEQSAYTPEQAVLLAMETLRSTNPSEAELVIIDEIEQEARERQGRTLAKTSRR